MSSDDDLIPDAFAHPAEDSHPATIAARVMKHPRLQHLAENEIELGWLMKLEPKDKAGKRVLGFVTAPAVQGELRDLFAQLLLDYLGRPVEFLIVLDNEFWQEATPLQREALVFHELCHIKQAMDKYGSPRFTREGAPVWQLVAHDLEAFDAEVARYGAWKSDIGSFLEAAKEA